MQKLGKQHNKKKHKMSKSNLRKLSKHNKNK